GRASGGAQSRGARRQHVPERRAGQPHAHHLRAGAAQRRLSDIARSAMNRRTFLLAGTIVGIGAAVPALALLATGPEDVVARIVRLRFPDARIADAELRAFARDFLVSDRTSGAKLAALRVGLPVMQSPALSGLTPERVQDLYDRFERRVVTKFALSTGFFERAGNDAALAASDQAPLRYRGLADPYLMGCANPLAVLDLD